MPTGPRALYIEFRRRFNGGNNGHIFLSHRDAAKALNMGRDTVSRYFKDLIERGFIVVTKGHFLGPEGIGQSTHYRLTEKAHKSKPATKDFMKWRQSKKQKPRRKIQHPMAGKSETPCRQIQPLNDLMSENPTAFGQKGASTVSENPAIYTSNHIPLTVGEAEQHMMQGLGLCGNAVAQVAT
jgi:DNA-binding transcriptional MocR family regulator